VVSRDGATEQDVPVPSGGDVRPIPLAHRAGNVEMKMLLRAPAAIVLGEPLQVTAQASAQAAGIAAELSLLDEVLDTVRASEGAESVTAGAAVTFSFVRRVGGVFAYQQTFAQGDGRTPGSSPTRTILLNWSDREPAIEMPFAWAVTAPVAANIRGRLFYSPAGRP
jgi:hypothetical protein